MVNPSYVSKNQTEIRVIEEDFSLTLIVSIAGNRTNFIPDTSDGSYVISFEEGKRRLSPPERTEQIAEEYLKERFKEKYIAHELNGMSLDPDKEKEPSSIDKNRFSGIMNLEGKVFYRADENH